MLKNGYRVTLSCNAFKCNKKWSERLKATFKKHGKPWNDRVEAEVKSKVADIVSSAPAKALAPSRRDSFDALLNALEDRLADLSGQREQ
jgi:transketolase